MSRTDRSREATGKNSNEGTSARTRPLSFEEIMSRRKKKLTADAKERATEMRESFEKGDANSSLEYLDSDRVLKNTKDSKDTVKGSSKKVEEAISKREQDHFEVRDNRNCASEANMKVKSSYSKSTRHKESKNEKQSHHRSRTSNRSGADAEKESEKKQTKGSVEKDKHEERDKKSRKEGKRKHESHIDNKSRSDMDGSISKKQDSGRLRDTEYSERKDRKKEHSQTYHEEPRSKRRRSRSWEYNRGRERSASMSPRAHRRPYHGRDYDEPSFQSFKDKSIRKYSDADKYRASGNGGYTSGHYRKHGSGLGGYSPRKRKTEAAVKTPSPTIRSPERKSSTWDQPPAGTSHAASGSMLANIQSPASKMLELISSTTVTLAATKPQPAPSLDITPKAMNASIDSVQLTQANRPMRRLYVDNLPPSASEKSVIDCFNDFLLSSGVNRVQGAKPCISCIINKEKCQALVEFLTPEDATTAFSFDGRSLSGSVLKIRRPKDFVEASTGAPEKTLPVVKAISDVVKDSPHKIFVGGISKALSSDMLMEIVSAFGLLRAYHFEFNEELNEPCAFLEYIDNSITLKACAGLNGMKLGGQVLTVVQALPDSHGEEEDAETTPSYGIPMHAKPLLGDCTQVLQLKNLFNREEFLLMSEPELEETLEDIRLECSRFGTVKSLNIAMYYSSCEGAPEQQHPNGDSGKIESGAEGPDTDSKKDRDDVPPLKDITELQDVREDTAHTNHTEHTDRNDENPSKDFEMKESTDPPLPADGASECLGNPLSDFDKGSLIVESGLVTEIPLQEVEVTLGEDANLKAEVSNGDGERMPVENTNLNTIAADGNVTNGDGNHQPRDLDAFEPGCVLVEFLRKEAACVAAHCLHGRSYGQRIVSVGYVPHDLYLARFPR